MQPDLRSWPDAYDGIGFGHAMLEWRFWALFVAILLLTFGVLGAGVHSASMFQDRGLSVQQAATTAGAAGLGALLGRVFVGALLDWWKASWVAALTLTAGAIGLAINATAATMPMLALGVFLGGLCIGAEGDLMPFFVRRYFGMRSFGAIYGAIFIAFALGGVIGPVVYGRAYDRFGGYAEVHYFAAALCVVSAFLLLSFGPYRYRAAENGAHGV